MSHNQRDLKHHEKKGQGHQPKGFEADPGVRREISPNDLVEDGQEEKEANPSQSQKAPAFLPHLQYLAESELQNRPAEIKTCSQNEGEKCVNDRWLDLDEGIVMQIDRQKAKNHNEDARDKGQDRDALEKDTAGDQRD